MASYAGYRSVHTYHEKTRDNPRIHDDINDPYMRWQLSQTPVLGGFYRALDQDKYYSDYLRNTRQTWADVKYPALLGGSTMMSAFMSVPVSGANMVISRNLMRMYK